MRGDTGTWHGKGRCPTCGAGDGDEEQLSSHVDRWPSVADGDSDRYDEWTDDEWKQAQAQVANRTDGDSEP